MELAEAERAAAELGFAALGEKSAEALRAGLRSTDIELDMDGPEAVSYTHLTLPTILLV